MRSTPNATPNTTDDQHLLRLEHVDREFQMGEVVVRALDDMTLDVMPGEFLVVIGPSGSGKTTLLNLLGGLDHPTSGTIQFRDRKLSAMTTRELTAYRRETVGFIFQFYNLIPNLTARENIMVATELVETSLDADHALARIDMTDRARHFPAQMSGGEQQRISIARAIAKRPALLLCDEPTGALDFETGKRVLRTLVDLRDEFGTTIVLITHNSAIAQVADRVIRLRSGRIIETTRNEQPARPEVIEW